MGVNSLNLRYMENVRSYVKSIMCIIAAQSVSECCYLTGDILKFQVHPKLTENFRFKAYTKSLINTLDRCTNEFKDDMLKVNCITTINWGDCVHYVVSFNTPDENVLTKVELHMHNSLNQINCELISIPDGWHDYYDGYVKPHELLGELVKDIVANPGKDTKLFDLYYTALAFDSEYNVSDIRTYLGTELSKYTLPKEAVDAYNTVAKNCMTYPVKIRDIKNYLDLFYHLKGLKV